MLEVHFMEPLALFGFAAALLIGTSLGLIGGGGSILTVPVLIYLLGVEPLLAVAYSLFIVGVSSFIGAINSISEGLLNYKTALIFAVPSFFTVFLTRNYFLPLLPNSWHTELGEEFIGNVLFGGTLILGVVLAAIILLKVDLSKSNPSLIKVISLMAPAAIMVFLVRQWIIPNIPTNIYHFDSFTLTKASATLVLFALVMVFASVRMIRGGAGSVINKLQENHFRLKAIFFQGVIVGALTGIVGAGGGFLIIPALVLMAKLPMKEAVATSLLIISINSLIGFMGDLSHQQIDWSFLLSFTFLSTLGIFIGGHFSKKISAEKLKKSFGWFVLIMAIFILSKQLL